MMSIIRCKFLDQECLPDEAIQLSGHTPLETTDNLSLEKFLSRASGHIFSLTLLLTVGKLFCSNPECRRRIFTERLPEVAAPWARKTVRLVQHLQAIGLALGGAAGARLGLQLGYRSCGRTLLNHLQSLPLPSFDVPKVLGVDRLCLPKRPPLWHYFGRFRNASADGSSRRPQSQDLSLLARSPSRHRSALP